MPMMACAVTDFPEPDSPRMASVSPSLTVKETPLIARATPSRVRNSTWRSSTSKSNPSTGCQPLRPPRVSAFRSTVPDVIDTIDPFSAHLRIEGVPDRITEHDEGQHGEHQEQRWEQQHMRRLPDQPDSGRLGD